jgi:uncharacterized protein (TIGR03084 family)
VQAITADLAAEHESLDAVVRDRPDADWDVPTPAPGWAVRDQIAHLRYFDATAVQAATDPDAFGRTTEALLAAGPDAALEPSRSLSPGELLAAWRKGRAELLEVLAMAARSFATARLMETWAHGQDVVDALVVTREPTDRLRHVAHIGVRARPFSYAVRGMELPTGEVHVALDPPGSGEPWTWNDPAAPDRVTGPALDFCLVVTQRRHPADTQLTVDGPLATEWIAIAQAFAGPPGAGRRPGQFASKRA